MEVENINVVGAKTLQAGVDRLENPLARLPQLIRPRIRGSLIAEFRRDNPAVTPLRDRATDDFLGAATVINVSGIKEVHTLIEPLVDNAPGSRFVRFAAEHHRAQTQGRNLERAAAQISIVHYLLSAGYACRCSGKGGCVPGTGFPRLEGCN